MSEARWKAKSFDKPSETDSILELRRKVFNEPAYDLARWRWQYESNPQGQPHIWLAVDAKDESRLAGHYAMIPYELRMEGHPVQACQSLDTFTSTDYRNQGIFVGLAEDCYRAAATQNIRAVIGFPNANSLPGFIKKLAFKDPFALHHYQRPLLLGFLSRRIPGVRGLPLMNRIGAVPLLVRPRLRKHESFEQIFALPADFEKLMAGFEKQFPIMIARTRAYMNWRYLQCPDRKYSCHELRRNGRLAGLAVTRVVEGAARTGQIIDLITDEAADRKPLLRHALGALVSVGAESAVTYFQEGSALSSCFRRAGFVKRGGATRFILRLLGPTGNHSELNQLADPTRWYLCGGDTDFF